MIQVRRVFACMALALAALFSCSFASAAQPFPSHAITFFIPFVLNPGADPFLRSLALEAGKTLGQAVILDYRAGGGGRIGLQPVLAGHGDPHQIAYGHTGNLVLQPLITPGMKIDVNKDYEAVATLYETKQAIYVNPSAPYHDVRGLIDYAKQHPGKLNGGSNGVGGPSHVALELFNTLANVNIVHVPYKGEAESIPALMADQIQMIITTAGPKGFVDAGRIAVLATTGTERWSIYPDKPTVMEAGLANFHFSVMVYVVAPPDSPTEAVAVLNQAFNKALRAPDVAHKLDPIGGDIVVESPSQSAARIRQEIEQLTPIVKKAGLASS
jgi:tripartite-type tricarboxylate transporter receptor subunit TctC